MLEDGKICARFRDGRNEMLAAVGLDRMAQPPQGLPLNAMIHRCRAQLPKGLPFRNIEPA
jgi:hypothetical protein